MPGQWTVLELSSAMLWWLGPGASLAGLEPWSPRVAVLTNLAPNHVDWHGSERHYMASKGAIRSAQHPGDAFVSLFGHEQPAAAEAAARAAGAAWWDAPLPDTTEALESLLERMDVPGAPGEHELRDSPRAIVALVLLAVCEEKQQSM